MLFKSNHRYLKKKKEKRNIHYWSYYSEQIGSNKNLSRYTVSFYVWDLKKFNVKYQISTKTIWKLSLQASSLSLRTMTSKCASNIRSKQQISVSGFPMPKANMDNQTESKWHVIYIWQAVQVWIVGLTLFLLPWLSWQFFIPFIFWIHRKQPI